MESRKSGELLATLAASVGGAALIVYLIGGAVEWLRFSENHVPATDALAVVAPEKLLVVGLRELITPMLALGASVLLQGLLFGFVSHRSQQRGDDDWIATPTIAFGAILLFVPVTAVSWSDVLVPYAALLFWLRRVRNDGGFERRRHLPLMIKLAVSAGAIIVVLSQVTESHPLTRAVVTSPTGTTSGFFISWTGSAVYVAESHRLTAIPTSKVIRVQMNEPRACSHATRSLFDIVLGRHHSYFDSSGTSVC